ncbi:MAG TPA: Asp23/Gls24 family envelope stress response protein [Clostridiales bacterium]|nr:Asp23/Gls24 family envelope stress response protein [Clostridiales bacterium]
MSDNKDHLEVQAEETTTSVKISDDVVATIAAIAAGEIEGVGGMCGSLAGDFIERLGKKNSAKGAKVEVEDGSVKISMNLLVVYNYRIQDVCSEVQAAVKNAVEGMTGLGVADVSITVQGIVMPHQETEDAEEDKEEQSI